MAALSFLLSDDACEGRLSRRDQYRANFPIAGSSDLNDLTHVVHVENMDHGFLEMDAESLDHAELLALSSLTGSRAVSAAIREVKPNGSLSAVIGRIMDFRDVEDVA